MRVLYRTGGEAPRQAVPLRVLLALARKTWIYAGKRRGIFTLLDFSLRSK